MPQFAYRAKDSQGVEVAGEIPAESISDAIARLDAKDLSVISIHVSEDAVPSSAESVDRGGDSVSLTMDDHFRMAFERRETLLPAVSALAEEMPSGAARREIRQLCDTLKNAEAPSDLRRSQMAVRWLPFLASGLSSDGTARYIGDFVSRATLESENRGRRLRLFAYPLIVFTLSFGVITMLCFVVLPTFVSMFKDFGIMLPGPTRLLIALGDPLHSHPIKSLVVIVLLMVSVFCVFRLWNRYAITTRYFGRVTAGNSANVSAMASLARQLAELISIDVSLPDALWIAGRNSGHHFFQGVTAELARDAHRGQLAESPVARTMPANLIHALQAGPDGQPSVPLLRELATIYGDRVADREDWSSGAVAQFALVLVGIVVAFFVVALFMPLVSLVYALS